MDSSGNTFIADSYNQRIRRIGTDGVVSTYAGTGEEGDEGDGGFATDAQFTYPLGPAIDVAGYLFIADTANHRIRGVTPEGFIYTAAGAGWAGYEPDGLESTGDAINQPFKLVFDTSGNLVFSDSWNAQVRIISFDAP